MKFYRLALILAAAMSFPLSLACAAPAEKGSGPRLHFEEMTFDFGQVVEGTMLEHTFKILNRGDQPLVIENVSPS